MSIVRWNPLGELDRFFDDDFFRFPALKSQGWGDLAVDVYEDGKNIVAEMNLPGFNPDSIDVEIDNDVLKISGNREEKKEDKNKGYYYKEIQRGSFERSVRLPQKVASEKASANYKDGVLKVVIPKAKESKGSKVKVKKE